VKLIYDEAFDRMALYVQSVGSLKVKLHRFLPDNSKSKHIVIKRKASGWYVCLMLDCPTRSPANRMACPPLAAIWACCGC
jgi:hypothetical protein